jgi:hypothetical protein
MIVFPPMRKNRAKHKEIIEFTFRQFLEILKNIMAQMVWLMTIRTRFNMGNHAGCD